MQPQHVWHCSSPVGDLFDVPIFAGNNKTTDLVCLMSGCVR